MKQYVFPFGIYILTVPLFDFLFRIDSQLVYAIKSVIVFALIVYFWKSYKIKFKLDVISIIAGVVIFFIWVGMENLYPKLYDIEFRPATDTMLLFKLFGFILAAPLIEEIFTRGFLIRFIANNNFEKVPMGKFTLPSFIITVLFFGFSHNRWLVGIIAGILLNFLYYRNKSVFSAIIAHLTANLLLAIYIVYNGLWHLW